MSVVLDEHEQAYISTREKIVDLTCATTYYDGVRRGVRRFAWWKHGVQYVGTSGKTLETALEEINWEERQSLSAIEAEYE